MLQLRTQPHLSCYLAAPKAAASVGVQVVTDIVISIHDSISSRLLPGKVVAVMFAVITPNCLSRYVDGVDNFSLTLPDSWVTAEGSITASQAGFGGATGTVAVASLAVLI
jgi:hypothetical protein